MKNSNTYLLALLSLFFSITSFSQISFEKGYYIDNQGNKIEGFIRNVDWLNNPVEIEFKVGETSEQKTISIDKIKEFGVYGQSKYLRTIVKIDTSSDKLEELSSVRTPEFKEREVLLKVLIEGKASLYSYTNEDFKRYFYSVDGQPITQLIYKKFRPGIIDTARPTSAYQAKSIVENNNYKQFIANNLSCEEIPALRIKKLEYNDRLIDYFTDYNVCQSSEQISYLPSKEMKKDLFNFSLRPGLNLYNISLQNQNSTFFFADFENKLGWRLGAELEFVLPFNKNKWAVVIEPTFQSLQGESSGSVSFNASEERVVNAKIDYESIELPIRIRHYMFLNDNFKLFINAGWNFDVVLGRKFILINSSILPIVSTSNLSFGSGFKINDKFSLEVKYNTKRDFQSFNYDEQNSVISLIFGYTLF